MRLKDYLIERSVAVYENPKGDNAKVEKDGKGFYAEINNDYDKDFKNKTELNRWLKKEKYELIGYD